MPLISKFMIDLDEKKQDIFETRIKRIKISINFYINQLVNFDIY